MDDKVGIHREHLFFVEFLAFVAGEIFNSVGCRLNNAVIPAENICGVTLAFFHAARGQTGNDGENGNDAKKFSHFLKF